MGLDPERGGPARDLALFKNGLMVFIIRKKPSQEGVHLCFLVPLFQSRRIMASGTSELSKSRSKSDSPVAACLSRIQEENRN